MSDMTEELTVLTGADARYLEDHKVSDQKMILVENYTEGAGRISNPKIRRRC